MEKERVEKTKTKEEKKLTEEKAAKVRGKKAKKAKKKPGKLHKTSIGMKIYSCMAVMGISFLIVVFANISILGTVEKNNDKLVNVYMELEQAKKRDCRVISADGKVRRVLCQPSKGYQLLRTGISDPDRA